ncbi:MAG: methyltransferase domain-containing protein [Actinomycetota bacterium]|nr:methyltransferase domain-containing protein [Actinomycetota bacterium]
MEKQYRNASNLNARITLHERFSVNPYPLPRWLFDQLELPPDARILEVGCGTGKLWSENLGRIPDGWDVMLTDASPGMVRETQGNLGDSRCFGFQVADVRELPFEDGMFDAVVANHVLYHVPDLRHAISELVRVLGHDGILYAATHGEDHMREMNPMIQFLDPNHPDDGLARRIGAFSLEDGSEQLSSHFSEVSLLRYEDALAVNETQPLVDYVLSAMTLQEAVADLAEEELSARISRLNQSLEQELSALGVIRITKETGLFVARRRS